MVAEAFGDSLPSLGSNDSQREGAGKNLQAAVSAERCPIPADVVALLNKSGQDPPDLTSSINSTQFLGPGMSFAGLAVIIQTCSQNKDANVLRALLTDTHGSVEGIFPLSMTDVLVPGKTVAVSGRTVSLEGRLLVLGQQVTAIRGLREGYKPASDGRRNVSEVSRRFGCLILRGRKCVLARDANRQLYIPADEPRNHETAQQAATRAVAEACDIFPDEFVLLGDVPPAMYYDKGGPVAMVVTIFAAVATNPPPPGSAEDADTIEDLDDMYDWFPYEQAISRLSDAKERHAITRLATGT